MTGNTGSQKVTLSFAKELYPKEAVLKAAYCFLDKCYVYLDHTDTDYTVELTAKGSAAPDNIKNEFTNELLAQTVRFSVYKQTHTIREILLARAMASTLVDEDPDRESVEQDTDLTNINMSWFDRYEKECEII